MKHGCKAILGAMVIAGVLGATARAQGEEITPIPASELTLHYYDPRLSRNDTLEAAQRLFGEQILVVQPGLPGRIGGTQWVDHFLTLGGVIVIRDTAAQGEKILQALAEIEGTIRPAEPQDARDRASELELFEYAPRHLSCRSAYIALSGFRRKISMPPPGPGEWTEVPNISLFEEGGLVLVRETPERLAEIRALLQRVDVPVPQAMFTLMVVRGVDQPSPLPDGLPAELAQNLARLVPVKGFELLATGAVRGALRGELVIHAVANVEEGPDLGLVLELEASAYDPSTREVTVERCRFVETSGEQSFETALSLRAGEYTVIGAVGSDPLFVVLRMEP